MNRVEYSVEASEDVHEVRGCTGRDREYENDILDELEGGNVWAWAFIKVTARIDGIECSDYLECARYDSEADFRRSGEYIEIKAELLGRLRADLERSLVDIDRAKNHLNLERRAHDFLNERSDNENN